MVNCSVRQKLSRKKRVIFITTIDFQILDFIREHLSCNFLDWIMPKITFLGNTGLIWIVITIMMMLLKNYRKTGIMLALGLLSGLIIGNLLLKNLVARERPCWINELPTLLIAVPQDYSFPSGHTLSSFIAAVIIMRSNKKAGCAAMLLAVLIAFSRLYLYVHFPSDVIAGILIGTAIGLAICEISKRITHKID